MDRADLEAGDDRVGGKHGVLKGGETSLFPYQIIDFAPTSVPTQPVLSRPFPPNTLHYTVALGSGREARYVCPQGRSLAI